MTRAQRIAANKDQAWLVGLRLIGEAIRLDRYREKLIAEGAFHALGSCHATAEAKRAEGHAYLKAALS
jgi:hypothetical protein